MANFQIGHALPDDDEDDEVGTRERRQSLRKKRHYKKDSRFVLDLYTLTFDENETVDELATCKTRVLDEEYVSISMPSSPTASRSSSIVHLPKRSSPAAPISLNISTSTSSSQKMSLALSRKSIPSLETNLHKILARKFLDSEEVSFRKAKLLTKAYYQLLRANTTDASATTEFVQGDAFQSYTPIVGHKRNSNNRDHVYKRQQSRSKIMLKTPIRDDRLSWPALLRADNKELSRMVAGLNNTVKALNDYLVELLQERDVLLNQQDEMLENISELTDNLL